MQQSLPRIQIPVFDGSPTKWLEFVVKFKDLVNDPHYLNNTQRMTYLLQHLEGEAKRAVHCFSNVKVVYSMALKRLKYMFGQKPRICQAYIQKMTRGKQIGNDDNKTLMEYYYTISDCIVALGQLNYTSDLYSSDILRQVIRRLPIRLHGKWAEFCFSLRRTKEPTLIDFEKWFQDRILAFKEAYLPVKNEPKKNRDTEEKYVGTTLTFNKCILCDNQHRFFKCNKYKALDHAERLSLVKEKNLCFNCLKSGHRTQSCKSPNSCFQQDCSKKHHTTLHYAFQKPPPERNEDKDDPSITVGMATHKSNEVFLQIVPVLIYSSTGKREKTYALLDTGSQSTLIREDFAAELKLNGTKTKIKMSSIKDQGETITVHAIDLKISSLANNKVFEAKGAFVIPMEKFNMPSQKYHGLQHARHLKSLKLADIRAEDIKILIGADVPEAFHQLDIKSGDKGEPVAIKTPFGWAVFGSKGVNKSNVNKIAVNCLSISSEGDLNNTLRSFWKMDSEIIKVAEEDGMSQDDKTCLTQLNQMTVYKEGKYEVPMLWQEENPPFPNNYKIALKRFNMLKQRLKQDSDLRKKYYDTINTYIKEGYAKKLSKEEACKVSKRTCYLPHLPIFNKNKPENSEWFLMQLQSIMVLA